MSIPWTLYFIETWKNIQLQLVVAWFRGVVSLFSHFKIIIKQNSKEDRKQIYWMVKILKFLDSVEP